MITLSIYDTSIAPDPLHEYYTPEELAKHKVQGFKYGCIETSYDQFPWAHCVPLDDYNSTIDEVEE